MQKFNSINLESKFIKNILQNTYIPTMPIVNDGDFVVSGSEYCYKTQLIECENTGILMGNGDIVDGIQYVPRTKGVGNSPSASDRALCSVDFLCGMGVRNASYKIIANLNSHTHLPGLTHQYKSPTSKYDAETHKYLGVYLRWYRDAYGIDLLPLYNCFCGESYTLAHIQNNKLVDGYDSSKNVNIVPIQLNRKYTVYVNSPHKVSMCGAFLNHNGRVLNPTNDSVYIDELLDNAVQHYTSCSYAQPIEYEAFTTDSKLIGHSNQFYLVIQTDVQHFCPIVVLEGTPEKMPNKFITSRETFGEEMNDIIDYSLFKPAIQSSMTLVPTSYHIPYAPRLLEFLTEHTITSAEDIPNNIARVQDKLNVARNQGAFRDVWNDELKFVAHNTYFKYTNNHYLQPHQLNEKHEPKIEVDYAGHTVYSKAPEFVKELYYALVKSENSDTYYYKPLTTNYNVYPN